MNAFENIQHKLNLFTRKYYTSELIKGIILFFSLGFLYFFFTLFIEYFLWLQPTARTFLFWSFILVELFLLIKFIVIPITKLIGFRQGISFKESSIIIGNHFPEVGDKLLNVLQLKESNTNSDLILASINQKSEELNPISFVKAIDLKKNSKYLKYAIIPILIYLISLFTIRTGSLTQSINRVVNYRTAYQPPAPFYFVIQNNNLQVIQGKSITIDVKTIGDILPNEAKIIFDKQEYYLQKNQNSSFSYTFTDVQEPINFFIDANGIQSQNYSIEVIQTPTINNISLELEYPKYLKKRNQTVQNSGNLIVPEGTNITWVVQTNQTDSLAFMHNSKTELFNKLSKDNFELKKQVKNPLVYQISSSNFKLKNYENLQFSVDVIKDEYPLISVTSNIDSISRGAGSICRTNFG